MEKKITNVKRWGPFKYTETITYTVGNNLFERAIDQLRYKLLFAPKQPKEQTKERKKIKVFKFFK